MTKRQPDILATLRQLVKASGRPINALARECGMSQSVLNRFARGQPGLTSANLQRLLAHFDLTLSRKEDHP
jgi:transcriptional regulator with XRE-family HTH domain